MKTKKTIGRNARMNTVSFLSLIVLVLAVLTSCSVSKKTANSTAVRNATEEEPYVVVEEMPMFPGGDSTLLAYIARNTNYPEKAKRNKTQGKVIVRFCVNASGTVDRISVLKGVSPDLDTEASRVVSTLPPFKPGRQSGKNVPVWYMVPISFELN